MFFSQVIKVIFYIISVKLVVWIILLFVCLFFKELPEGLMFVWEKNALKCVSKPIKKRLVVDTIKIISSISILRFTITKMAMFSLLLPRK